MDLPTGTVTFLFTDLETSTRNWEEQPDGVMRDAITRHDEILRDAIEGHNGVVFSTMGDGMAAVFTSAPDAVAAALDAQRGLLADEWGFRGILAGREGNWEVALQSFVAAASDQFAYDETMMLLGSYWGTAFALARLGDLESTAVVLGYTAVHFPAVRDEEWIALMAETEALIRDGLGDDEVARLEAHGTTLDTRDVIALMNTAAAEVLAT